MNDIDRFIRIEDKNNLQKTSTAVLSPNAPFVVSTLFWIGSASVPHDEFGFFPLNAMFADVIPVPFIPAELHYSFYPITVELGNQHLSKDHFPSACLFACSAASSMPPTYMKAFSGRWSHLPSHNSLNERMVSASGVTLPGLLVNASATMNGCDRNFS